MNQIFKTAPDLLAPGNSSGLAASASQKFQVDVFLPERANPLGAEATALAEGTASADAQLGLNFETKSRKPSNSLEHICAEALNWRSTSIIVAGVELGLWMCLAFGLEVLGVQVPQGFLCYT